MNAVGVMLLLVLDAGLAGTGAWMIYDHVRQPAPAERAGLGPGVSAVGSHDRVAAGMNDRVDAGMVAVASSSPGASPGPGSAHGPGATPAGKAAPAGPATSGPVERPQPQRPVTVPSLGSRLPDKPPPVPVQAFADGGTLPSAPPLPPILRPRVDLAPSAPPDAAIAPIVLPAAAPATLPDASIANAGPDPWIESMTRGIRNVVEDHRDLIEDCYVRAAKEGTRDVPIQGRVEVHLTIVPSGDAEDVRVVENQTGSEELGTCLVSIMRSWRYPAPGQEAMEFVWPFNFQSAGQPRNPPGSP